MSRLCNEPYADEEIEFLREYRPSHTFEETLEEFNKRFEPVTLAGIKHRCSKFKIHALKDSRFQKNHHTWNKGISIKTERPELYREFIERSQKQNKCFVKGAKCFTIKPIGAEYKSHGYTLIKIAMPDVWVSKARYMYEKLNETKLTDKQKVIFLDGDDTNYSKENLMAVENSVMPKMAKQHLFTKNADLTKAAAIMCKLELKTKEAENGKKER